MRVIAVSSCAGITGILRRMFNQGAHTAELIGIRALVSEQVDAPADEASPRRTG